ncbi:unnamed protein product [Hermetia illucens]|uniref:PPM-type phosphatase domain-containing protein n=2 Tax=Hermetia illucens TaxID=343691 RepID=A0A7R8V367_HERIL|nr:unnamed protein product [Hermetia illucens]
MLTITNRLTVISTKSGRHGVLRQVFTSPRVRSALPQLSPYDVNLILREHEYTHSFSEGCVKGYDSNQLGSNSPMEDSRTEATILNTNGFICGVFDGHGGAACAQVVSKRLLRYISTAVQSKELIRNLTSEQEVRSQSFLKCHNDKVDFVSEVRSLYEKSYQSYLKYLLNEAGDDNDRVNIITNAFLHLDNDLSKEALDSPSIRTLSVAMSGAVTCVSLIEGRELYLASTGDCTAVLGSVTDTGQWVAKKLNHEHTTDNIQEVRRILDEHPQAERESIIRNERLLGQLAPLRALGDFRYKWSNDILQKVVVPTFGEMSVPPNYYTPPYLTARPDITHHTLKPNDLFLIVASDGLWDFLSPTQAVGLVGEHMAGKGYLEPLKLPSSGVTLEEILNILEKRKAGRKKKPLDKNAATHLIRNALGGTEYGIEHSKLSHLLSLPQDVVRLFRDDITITVVYFNQEYLKKPHF